MTATPERRLRVVVAEDHPVFRDGVVSVLADRGHEVVAAVDSGPRAVAATLEHRPDVVLMDLTMPDGDGLEAMRAIASAEVDTAVLVLTMSGDDASVFAALRAGARGYLLKESRADQITHAVEAVAAGGSVLSAGVATRVFDAATTPTARDGRPFPQLTDREFEVLAHLGRGHTNAVIAARLGLAEKTVRNVVSVVLAKVGVATRGEAGAAARDAGLDPPG